MKVTEDSKPEDIEKAFQDSEDVTEELKAKLEIAASNTIKKATGGDL